MKKIFLKITFLAIIFSSFSVNATNQKADLKNNSFSNTVVTAVPEILFIFPLYGPDGEVIGAIIIFTDGRMGIYTINE